MEVLTIVKFARESPSSNSVSNRYCRERGYRYLTQDVTVIVAHIVSDDNPQQMLYSFCERGGSNLLQPGHIIAAQPFVCPRWN